MKKQKSKENRIIYYSDEINDDFQNTKTNKNAFIDGKFRYKSKNAFTRFFSDVVYYLVIGLLWVFMMPFKRTKIVGRKNIKRIKKSGYILYLNHTNAFDAFVGQVCLSRPKRTFIIANKDAFSIKGITGLVKALGALPVPDTASGLKNLEEFVLKELKNKKAITIFPEAHIWPYYTGLRPFRAISFKFAVKANVPAVPVAVTYEKPKGKNWQNKKPRSIVYVGQPIYPKQGDISLQENAMFLRDETVKFIESKVINKENYPYITYIKKEKKDEKVERN